MVTPDQMGNFGLGFGDGRLLRFLAELSCWDLGLPRFDG